MRRRWTSLMLLFFLASCSNAKQDLKLKCGKSLPVADREHGKKADLQAYLDRLFGKKLFKGKGCAGISVSSDSLFEPHSNEIKSANWAAPIATVAAICKRYPEAKVVVSAYTDCLHSEEQNIVLSQSQAKMIKKALVDRGIASRKITAEGWGESRPVASNATRQGRKANRRITIFFYPAKARCVDRPNAGKLLAGGPPGRQLNSATAVADFSKNP